MKLFKPMIAAALFCTLAPGLFAEDTKPQSEQDALKITVAELNISNLPIRDALAKVAELSKAGDPAKQGVSILLDPRVDASTIKAVSLNLKNVPVYDVVRVIAALSGLEAKYEEKAVILVALKPAPAS